MLRNAVVVEDVIRVVDEVLSCFKQILIDDRVFGQRLLSPDRSVAKRLIVSVRPAVASGSQRAAADRGWPAP